MDKDDEAVRGMSASNTMSQMARAAKHGFFAALSNHKKREEIIKGELEKFCGIAQVFQAAAENRNQNIENAALYSAMNFAAGRLSANEKALVTRTIRCALPLAETLLANPRLRPGAEFISEINLLIPKFDRILEIVMNRLPFQVFAHSFLGIRETSGRPSI